ncbi:kynurenine 3-monooxygenase, mitochondrial precursor [Elasticomyces elasticus]|nr:kynurenine 3-monooxygenase, mitochondrial precursor [Elasticomyces elasticus]
MVLPPKIVIVGGGPVGALAGLYAAKRGFRVEVYDLRDDIQKPSLRVDASKSLNLTLSERGLQAIAGAECPGLLENVIKDAVPIHCRMVHGVNGDKLTQKSMKYDVHGRVCYVVQREVIGRTLMVALGKQSNVRLCFRHKLQSCDFKKKVATFEILSSAQTDSETKRPTLLTTVGWISLADVRTASKCAVVDFDFLIGADGVHSNTRGQLLRQSRVDFSQRWLDDMWCEFDMAAKPDGAHAIAADHLHLWPQKDCIFLAQPNNNGTFACALFAPESVFHRLEKEPESIIPFFRANFPGVTPDLIPTEDIVRHFSTNPHFPLLTTKCNKYHYGDSFLLVGDACHALVPFYGVGMNVGFEDVQTFFRDFLDKGKKFDGTLSPLSEKHGELEIGASICTVALLDAYTAHRRPDIHAITDLALEHYDALKVGVNTWSYLLRRWIEDTLEFYAPGMGWTTTYNRVTYGKERFSEVVKKEQGQGQVLAFAAGLLCVGLFVALLYLIGL